MSELNASNLRKEHGNEGPDLVGTTELTSPYFMVPPSGTTKERPENPEPGTLRFNTDIGNLEYFKGGIQGWESINRVSSNLNGGARGIWGGGSPGPVDVIQYVTISTLGNATDFGDLTQARQAVSGASSQTRGVVAGGYVYGSPAGTFNINTIDYITIATTGNAIDFGDLIVGAMAKSVGNCSDQTRGVFTGGKTAAPTYINTIEIVTIATTGNASDFGDLKRTRAYGSVFCDSHGGLS